MPHPPPVSVTPPLAAERSSWRGDASTVTLRHMDRELEALGKTRGHVADIAKLAEMAREHLEEGRFENASACLRLIEQHASIGRETLRSLFDK